MSGPEALGAWLAAHLQQVRTEAGGWLKACCPLHADDSPSLRVNLATGGAKCHAGCEIKPGTIWRLAELAGLPAPPDLRPKPEKAPRGPAGEWIYHTPAGEPLLRVRRLEVPGGKSYPQATWDGKAWTKGGLAWTPLYRADRLAAAPPGELVFIVEGEKAADYAASWGLLATTAPEGAGKWRKLDPSYRDLLRGRDVVILPDNDEPGRKHAFQVAADLEGFAARVTTVALPGLPEKGDLVDFGRKGGTRQQLLDLVEAERPPCEPTPAPPSLRPAWPGPLAEEALHGLAGDLVRALAPVTEADPGGLLLQALITFGHQVGRGPHYCVEATEHHANLFGVLVGATAAARKGTGWDRVRQIAHRAIPDGPGALQAVSGAGSGEGVIARAADKPGRTPEADAEAKRVLIEEPEFGGLLRVASRDGNLLSPTLRNAWDGRKLSNLVKHDSLTSTGHGIGMLGHITAEELARLLTDVDCANGFGNRILWWCVRRSQYLPEGGDLAPEVIDDLADRWRLAVRTARELGHYRMHRTPRARALWAELYPLLSEPPPGLAGQLLSRGAPMVVRLSLVYALLDRSHVIKPEHLLAALAVWDYACASVRYLFGERLADPDADTLLAELRATPEGLTRTEIVHQAFGRNKRRAEIDRALGTLQELGLAFPLTTKTGEKGRPAERWFANNVVNVVCRNGSPSSPLSTCATYYVVYVVKGREVLDRLPEPASDQTTKYKNDIITLNPCQTPGCANQVRQAAGASTVSLCGPCRRAELEQAGAALGGAL